MGYRASAITEHTGVTIPQWFKDKWDKELNIPIYEGEMFRAEVIGNPRTPISYKYERKYHSEVIEDLQKVVAEDKEWSGDNLKMIMIHEDDKVNRISIYADKVIIEAPTEWEVVEDLWMY